MLERINEVRSRISERVEDYMLHRAVEQFKKKLAPLDLTVEPQLIGARKKAMDYDWYIEQKVWGSVDNDSFRVLFEWTDHELFFNYRAYGPSLLAEKDKSVYLIDLNKEDNIRVTRQEDTRFLLFSENGTVYWAEDFKNSAQDTKDHSFGKPINSTDGKRWVLDRTNATIGKK